jgi:hypothetical protein
MSWESVLNDETHPVGAFLLMFQLTNRLVEYACLCVNKSLELVGIVFVHINSLE